MENKNTCRNNNKKNRGFSKKHKKPESRVTRVQKGRGVGIENSNVTRIGEQR